MSVCGFWYLKVVLKFQRTNVNQNLKVSVKQKISLAGKPVTTSL